MKKLIFILMTPFLFCVCNSMYAQAGTNKITATEEITPANVLKWTKEVLPKMERLVPKLEKIKVGTTPQAHPDALRLLATVNHLKEVNAKGTKLKAAEAKKYYDLIAATVNSFYIECQSGPGGGVCCVDCHNHGILGIWCFANCFVARFPGID